MPSYLVPSLMASLTLIAPLAIAQQAPQRTYERIFFDQFSPQTALEMIVRVPGFSFQEADTDRGLSQGGTNVLLNGRVITGKGGAATQQLSQISASSVIRIEILDAGALDLPGFSGLVANIVTRRSSIKGNVLWEPEVRQAADPAWAIGNATVSASFGDVDVSASLESTMVRVLFEGPETLSDPEGNVFETREESLSIRGVQPVLSGSLTWTRPNGHILNTKASYDRLSVDRVQTSLTSAVLPRGVDSLNIAGSEQDQSILRLDADYQLPAFAGTLKLIGFANLQDRYVSTRLTIDDPTGVPLAEQGFDEASRELEGVLRAEQTWSSGDTRSWQLAAEGVFNQLDLATEFLIFDPADPAEIIAQQSLDTVIEEWRGEATLAHRRKLGLKSDIQLSIGGEYSVIRQGEIEREFVRPKGFLALTTRPTQNWTLTGRIAREVGQINFRDFAASVSLFDEIARENNSELVPDQSWLLSGRAERRFKSGHVLAITAEHERITDLVDRIPLGDTGDAIGNIPSSTRSSIGATATLLGAPFGLKGAQLDLRARFQWSSVIDPLEGFQREIGNLRTRDLRAEFRHDIPGTDWAYGFVFREQELAPVFQATLVQFRNVPGGALTPGENSVFLEHKDFFGLRARLQVSEFIGQRTDFTRIISAGRRDTAPLDRIEDRSRSLNGPVISLSIGRAF